MKQLRLRYLVEPEVEAQADAKLVAEIGFHPVVQPTWKNQHTAGCRSVADLSYGPRGVFRDRTRPHARDVPGILKEDIATFFVGIDVVDTAEEGIGMTMDDAGR